jgi:hypothetical protein
MAWDGVIASGFEKEKKPRHGAPTLGKTTLGKARLSANRKARGWFIAQMACII